MKKLKSTIMIPAYNVEKFVSASLRSALNQTYKGNYEVLVVNDGSTDGTREIIENFAGQTSMVRLINQENLGTSSARNRLLSESKGEILLGLDADDVLHPKALETVIEYFDGFSKIDYIYTNQFEIDESGKILGERKREEIHKFSDKLTYHCHFQGHLKSFRKNSIKNIRFNESLKSAVDWDFFLKLFSHANIFHVPEMLYFYRLNQKGISFAKRDEVIKNSRDLVARYIKKRKLYGGKDFEIVPVNVGKNIYYYDHFIDGESVMDCNHRQVLEKFLRCN